MTPKIIKVHEALVNALVHRDYQIQGSEIHVDMYDDRLEIVSPGEMPDGKRIQDLNAEIITSSSLPGLSHISWFTSAHGCFS